MMCVCLCPCVRCDACALTILKGREKRELLYSSVVNFTREKWIFILLSDVVVSDAYILISILFCVLYVWMYVHMYMFSYCYSDFYDVMNVCVSIIL